MTVEEKLNSFYNSSIENARQESEQILAAHREAMEKIAAERRQDIDSRNENRIHVETEELYRQKNMVLSREQLQIKRKLSRRQAEQQERLFGEVRKKLEAFCREPAYDELLDNMAVRVMSEAQGEQVKLYVNETDREKIPHLASLTGTDVFVSTHQMIGGIRAKIEARNILIDSSFASRLDEFREGYTQ